MVYGSCLIPHTSLVTDFFFKIIKKRIWAFVRKFNVAQVTKIIQKNKNKIPYIKK